MDYEISENHLRSFSSLAHVIERKLLEMQMALVAHRHRMRFVHIHYSEKISEDDIKKIEESINNLYDLLEQFCNDYNIPPEELNLKNELLVKTNFLWEDLTGATAKSLRGHGAVDEELKIDYEQKITRMINDTNKLIKQFN